MRAKAAGEAYRARMRQVAESKDATRSGLGLVRIAYEGQSILDFYINAQNLLDRVYFNNQVYPATEQLFLLIGRREGCDVCLNYDSQVSREHAMISYDGEHFWLEDTNSTSGSFLGDEKISDRDEVQHGELFRVGRTWMRIEPET